MPKSQFLLQNGLREVMSIKTKEFIAYLIIALASGSLIFASLKVGDHGDTLSSFLKELGFAGIIALIVIFTVERFSKGRHVKESNEFVESLINKINNSMFHAIYDRNLPHPIFKEIEEVVLSSQAYTKDSRLDYTISFSIKDSNLLENTARHRYILCNATSKKISYEVNWCLVRSIEDKYFDECKVLEAWIGDKKLSHEEISANQRLF
jgi:hypothetical protein